MRTRMLITLLLLAVANMAGAQGVCDSVPTPWSDPFDTYTTGTEAMPDCWVAFRNYDMGYPPHLATEASHSGAASLVLYPGSLAESHYSMVIGPALRVDGLEGLHLKFAMRSANTAARLEVGLCLDTGRYTRAFSPIDTLHVEASNQWQEVVIDLTPYSQLGKRIGFRMQRGLQSDGEAMYVDDVRVEACGTGQPWVSHLTSTGLTLHFEAYGDGAIAVGYGATTLTDVHSPLTIEGLEPSTTYTFSVGCADGEVQTLEATTLEGAGYAPAYYQPFDAMPSGWRIGGTHSVGGGVLRLGTTGADTLLAVLPLQDAAPTAELTVALRHRASGSTRIEVGVMQYATEPSSFAPIRLLTPTAQWATDTVSLAPYDGNGRYIALRMSGSGTAELDYLRVARCMLANLRTYNLTDHSITLAWDTLVGQPEVGILMGGDTVRPTSNPYTLEGLMPSQSYLLHLVPLCGDGTCAADRIGFSTFAHEVAIPYCVDFEASAALPHGWVGEGGASIGTSAYEGSRALALANGAQATLPLIDDDAEVVVEFYLRGSGTLRIGIVDNPYAPFEQQQSVAATAVWQRHRVRLSGLTGRSLALRAEGTMSLDNLGIVRQVVEHVEVSHTSRTSTTLNWEPQQAVNIEYKAVANEADDFAEGSGIALMSPDATAFDLEGLQPGTWYAVHIGSADQCFAERLHLYTLPPPADLPYCTDFDQLAVNAYPTDWRRLSAYGEYPIVSTERNQSGRSLRFSATASAPTLALLPDVPSCGEHLSLGFWHNTTLRAEGAMLIVGHLPNADDLGSFSGIDTIRLGATDQWRFSHVDIGSDGTRVALMLVGGSTGETRTFIDNLCLEACASYNIAVSATDSSVRVAWQADDEVQMAYTLSATGHQEQGVASASPFVIEGLEAATAYTLQLRTLCDCGKVGGTYTYIGSTGRIQTDTIRYFQIHTEPPTRSMPWCETFESRPTGTLPYYWNSVGSATITDRNYAAGSHGLLISGATTLVLPRTADISQGLLSLQLYTPDEAALADGAVVVGVMPRPDSLQHFVPVDTLRLGHIGEWERHMANLGSYTGEGLYPALRTAAGVKLYIDNISIDTAALLRATANSTGLIVWQSIGNLRGVRIEYGEPGFSIGHADTSYTSFYLLPDFDPQADYEVRLTPLGSCMPLTVEIGSYTALPYCEQFENAPMDGMPQGWLPCRSYSSTPNIATLSSSKTLHMRGQTTAHSIVALPQLAAESLADLELSLSMRAATNNALLIVGEVDDNADPNTFAPFDTLQPSAPNTWERMHLPLGRHQGTAQRLAIACGATGQQAEVWITDVSIVQGHTPTIAATSARRVALRCADADYYVAYGTAGTAMADATLRHIASREATIDDLEPSTTYWFYPLYGSPDPTCEPPIVVSTPSIQPLPYCIADTTISTLVLPEPEAEALADLHLYLRLGGSEAVEVGILQSPSNWATFFPLDTLRPDASTLAHTALASYTGEGRFLGLRTLGGGNAHLSDLTLAACMRPTLVLDNDNRVHLGGSGWVDYGEGGIHFVADTTLGPLADTALYAFHFFCTEEELQCASPLLLRTTYHAPLPYCADSVGGLMPVFGADTLYAHYITPQGREVDTVMPNPTGRPTLPSTVRNLEIDRCPLPRSLTVMQLGNGQTALGWPDSLGGFYIEYVLQGESSGHIVVADEQPLWLNLMPDTTYLLYLRCQPSDNECRPAQQFRTLDAPTPLPYCTAFADMGEGQVPTAWRVLTDRPNNYGRIESPSRFTLRNYGGTSIAVLPQFEVDSLRRLGITLYARFRNSNGHTLTLGTMTDANNAASFDPVATFSSIGGGYHRLFHSMADYYGNGRFLALRVSDDDLLDIDSIAISTCYANGFALVEREATHALFDWEQQGAPLVSIEYGPRGFDRGSGTIVHPTAPPFTLEGLTPLTNYTFLLSASCPDDGGCAFRSPTDTLFTFSPQGTTGCIDYTDLASPNVVCNTGSYANPTATTGAVDYGYLNAESRHTIHFDTTERDPRTGGLLRTVPIGHRASVRLGNWTTGGNTEPQAESITYAMTIDPTEADLLILKYAAVLQDPEHAPSLQPRFRLQILDSVGQLIDSCGMADFIANADLGWNQAPNEVLWKDWTTVGLDLTAYSGQSILIRLITNDCGEGSHFGYAYFTLECASRRMQSEGCSNVPSNRFTVPSGFAYSWYTNHSDSVISTSNSILVPSNNDITYLCRLSFVDNPSCHFTMSAFAGARYPLALFDTALTVADCAFDLVLTNRSTISNDGLTPLGTGEPVERIEWLLPDGTQSTAIAPTLHLTDSGLYTVQLVAGIANDQCLDTLRRTLHLVYPHPKPTLEAPDHWCTATAPAEATVSEAASYHWADGSSGTALLAPEADTLLTAYCTDLNGCHHTLQHPLRSSPSYLIEEQDHLCATAPSYTWHDTTLLFASAASGYTSTAHYSLLRHTADGCDSLHTLSLTRTPYFDLHHTDTLCHADSLRFFDTILATTGLYIHHSTTHYGCDSTVSLDLTVRPPIARTDYREACDSLRWTNGLLYTRDTIGPLDTLRTAHGCDSVLTLALELHPSYLFLEQDTLCQGDTTRWHHMRLSLDGLYADTLRSAHGCDSIRTLQLTMNRTPKIDLEADYDCATLVYTIEASTSVPNYQWHSYPTDSLFDLGATLRPQVLPTEPTTYTLQAWHDGAYPCPASASIDLQPAQRPRASLRATMGDNGSQISLTDLGTNYDDRTWLVNHTPLDSRARFLTLPTPEGVDTVWIMLVADDGHCTDTATRFLTIDHSGLLVPNIFTPNAESNTHFRVGARSLSFFEMRIYNRHGLLVFQTTNINNPWDGTDLAGQPCPTGAYVYRITYSSVYQPTSKHSQTGTLTLVR